MARPLAMTLPHFKRSFLLRRDFWRPRVEQAYRLFTRVNVTYPIFLIALHQKRERGEPALRIGDVGPMGRILIKGEPGTEIVDELTPQEGEIVVDKPGKGAFYATRLNDHLTRFGTKSIIFAGVTTEVCVQSTMREANDRGYECLLASDATESYFHGFKAVTIEMIAAQGAIVGWTATVSEIEEALNG